MFWTLFELGFQISYRFWTMVGLGLFRKSGLLENQDWIWTAKYDSPFVPDSGHLWQR